MSSSGLIMSHSPWMEDKKNKNLSDDERENFMEMVQEIARSELRETENAKEQCLEQFRTWINQNADIENCITGKI